jgi:glycosyltransferase involved in cell wall biosynthesis
MGAGKVIVSTPNACARELLDVERGVFVPPESPHELARAFMTLLGDPVRRTAMGAKAYRHGRTMVWPTVLTSTGT